MHGLVLRNTQVKVLAGDAVPARPQSTAVSIITIDLSINILEIENAPRLSDTIVSINLAQFGCSGRFYAGCYRGGWPR